MNAPLIAIRRGNTVELTLNRPERRNALSRELITRLTEELHAAAADAAVRCVILTGAPPAFCAGLDLREVLDTGAADTAHDTTALLGLYETIEQLRLPVVAAVNGSALAGGAALLCVCDLALCGESASVGYPGIRHGLVAPVVMPYLLRLVGERRARYLLLTGETISAAQAVALGLADKVVADTELLPQARGVAERLAAHPPEALARTKALLCRLRDSGAARWADESGRWGGAVSLTAEARARLADFLDT